MTDLVAAEQEVAARLIERLLTDSRFRLRFRKDPAQACREAGLDVLADELSLAEGNAMMTLEVRESKSSLAGVVMAAAMEGVAIAKFVEHVVPALEDTASGVGDVLSHVSLPAIKEAVDGVGGGAATAAAAAPGGSPLEAATEARGDAGAASPPAPQAAPPPAPPPEKAPSPEEVAAGLEPGSAKNAPDDDGDARRPADEGAGAPAAGSADDQLPSATDLPDAGSVADAQLPEAPGAAQPPAAGANGGDAAGVATAGADEAAAASRPPDPSDYGIDGTGGKPTPETLALLENDNITFDDVGIADLEAGRIDPRVVALLTRLSKDHEITVTCMCSDHSRNTASGGVSNHSLGRGVDIGTIDGELVRPGSLAARELATELAEIEGDIRPDEVGTPFNIAEAGYFTDAAHQDHIHIGFKTEISPDWKPPTDVAVGSAVAAAARDVAAAPAAVAAAADPSADGDVLAAAAPAGSQTDRFMAVTDAKAAGRAARTGAFIAAAAAPPAAATEAEAADAAGADAAGADAAGTGGGEPGEYPGDDAPKEEIALWMARRAEAAGLPPELPVMAALVESNLQNLDYGDASSEGYFQMLTTLWDNGKYAGFQKDPEKQIQWFIDTASPLKARFGDLPRTAENLGTWVADTERPAEQYRGRYALRLDEARRLIEQGKERAAAGPAAEAPAREPPSPAAAEAPAATARPPDPDDYGQDGTGGKPTPETLALLENDNITFDDVGIADLEAGRIDPRVVAMLTRLSEKHEITVTCMCSDHSRLTAGGSVSNHALGRGVDIGTIDGELVRPGSEAARKLAEELQTLESAIRPDEVGTPFSMSAPGYFTDSAHQDHIHIGFKTEISPDWKPPADVAAGGGHGAAPAAAVAAAVPAEGAAPVAAPAGSVTDRFMAVDPTVAAAGAQPAETGAFLALQPPGSTAPVGPASALADASAVPAAVGDANAAAAAGGSRLGAAALQAARGELGVRESGTNTGVEVDKYLAAAGVAPGNPWCAGFVTWALEQSGHKMEGGGWAAVQTWVRAAEAGTNDLQVVSAEEARPGDLVAYDWGGQDDFGADGHIGFLQSKVAHGKFTALEGNQSDAVLEVPRQLGGGTNVKFLRIGAGEAPSAPDGADLGQRALASAEAPPAVQGAPADVDVSSAGDGYPGDDASKAEIAAWMAREAEKRGLPKELPIMASLVESGMRNVRYGDADSVGFFQMRVGIWNRGEYAGYPEKPELQIEWFLDKAEEVKAQRLGRGLPVDDAKHYGEWIADVERPAEQYRDRYQLKLAEARNLLKQVDAEAPSAQIASVAPPPEPKADAQSETDEFMAIRERDAPKHRLTAKFLKAVEPSQGKAPAAAPSPEELAAGDVVAGGDAGGPAPQSAEEFDLGPESDYPGDDADRKEIARWMARHARKAGLPPELPVMAALVESNLKNLPYGHSTSVGYFQMLTTYWDKGKYAGYQKDADKQIQWFIDHALVEKEKRISRGAPIDDPRHFGEWIADVERPAAEYRGRYQLRLEQARNLLRS